MDVTIPDETWPVAKTAALIRWETGSADTTQMLLCVRAALEAAVPAILAAERRRISDEILAYDQEWSATSWQFIAARIARGES